MDKKSENCKLHWFPKFYNQVILFIGLKILVTFWLVNSKIVESDLFKQYDTYFNTSAIVLSLMIPDVIIKSRYKWGHFKQRSCNQRISWNQKMPKGLILSPKDIFLLHYIVDSLHYIILFLDLESGPCSGIMIHSPRNHQWDLERELH